MLRVLVNQVASSYYYTISNRWHPLQRVVADKRISLEQFVDLAPWGNNLQSKLIGGLAMVDVNPPAALAAAQRGEFVVYDDFAGRHCDSEVLAAAKRNLRETFSVVGLTERFEESLAWMMIEFSWDVPFYQSFRKSSKRPTDMTIDKAVRKKIEDYNSFDIELHEFGKQVFVNAMAQHRDAVARIRRQFNKSPKITPWRAYYRAGVAWSRGLASILRSAT